jgi:flagellar biosynthetic protein FliR
VDLLAPSAPATLVLLACRISGVVLAAPMFSSNVVPTMVKTCIVVLLTWLMHPLALSLVHGPVAITPAHAMNETVIGLAIGIGGAVLIGAAEAMGDLLATHIGLSGASALDPTSNMNVPVLGQFAGVFAVTMMLTVNGHIVMLDALAQSLRMLPVGGEVNLADGAHAVFATGSTLFLLGVRFAAPVLATVLLANVALAVLTRAAPQLNVLSIAFPIQIGVGLFALAASVPAIGAFYLGWDAAYNELVGHLMTALGAGGR